MTNIIEIAKVALSNLSRQGLRSYLTLIGVVIGIAAIVTLISLGAGLNNAVVDQFEQLGSNTIFLTPGGAGMGGSGTALLGATELSDSEIARMKAIPEVASVIAPFSTNATIEYGKEVRKISIMAADAAEADFFEDSGFLEIEEGRSFEGNDGFVAIIGPSIATDVFSKDVALHDRIIINGKSFKVVAIAKKTSQSFGGGPNTNNSIFITKRSFNETFPSVNPIFALIKAEKKEDVQIVKEKIEKIFEKDYGKDQKEFMVVTSEQVLEQIDRVLGIIQIFLVGIASISLLVGSIGIMNTMIMAVMERTKEIGVMKAIGATNNLVLTIFILEAGFIGLVGGIIGVIIGYGLAFGVGAIAESAAFALKVELDPMLIIGAMLFSLIVGMAAGAYPANKAARLDPVDALRGSE
ncbi:MAG TPA: ABC transporter permease [Candidatus Diapherotrites archaeon]|uniref:ABC transporter permease n=1 Tax=Candidatus Iainarchaeum sp. TaxID=3101447 RepID=A0A7J4IWT7_9ARCH|nr:ABC transporter permease [Candidatus Diapherotrites archaeon]